MSLLQDLRFGLRQLRLRPGPTFSIVLVLAVGIGANTAMFSAFEAWVLRPLDFSEPDRLIALDESQPRLGRDRVPVSALNLGDWMQEQQSFEQLGAFQRHNFNLNDPVEPVRLTGARVTASLFPLLRKPPSRGRVFSPSEDLPGQSAAVALISDQLWRERFDSDPAVIGQAVRLDGRPHQIVGVMEPGFRFPEWADVWTPLGLDTQTGNRGNRWLNVIGRLRPGVTREAAQADMSAIAARLDKMYPETNRGWSVQVLTLHEWFVPQVISVALTASMGSGLFVLLIICANVASLMLAQATARGREMAIRVALGARRSRLVRQSVVEGVVIAIPAGALGVGVAVMGVNWMLSYVPVDPPYLFGMSFSPSAGVYTLAVSILAGMACGVVPVVRNTGLRLCEALKSGGIKGSGGRASGRLRSGLVIGELALSTALVICALLMVKSFLAIQGADGGYRQDGVLTSRLSLTGEGLELPSQRRAVVDRLLASIESIPRVRHAVVTSQLPASNALRIWQFEAEGRPVEPGEEIDATVHAVAGQNLETLAIPLLAGRDLTDSEKRNGGPVALVSAGLAQLLWGDEDPVGRRLRRAGATGEDWITIVGLVGHVDFGRDMTSFGRIPDGQIYLPYGELTFSTISVAVYSDSPPRVLTAPLRQALLAGAPGVPISEILTMDDLVFRVRWVTRFFSRQLAIYAALALAIAAFGVYGLTADAVSRRTRELAIRMALGAKRGDVIRLVLRGAAVLAVAGIGVGVLFALAVTRFGTSMLQQVGAQDPLVFAGVAVTLLGVTLAAALLPARRATALDPNTALRTE